MLALAPRAALAARAALAPRATLAAGGLRLAIFLLVFLPAIALADKERYSAEALAGMRFEAVGSDGELADAEVTCILQDRTGFVWLGTYANGLYRFDGHELRHYATDSEDPTTLSSNTIWSLAEDGEGFVWVGTWGAGLCRFDPRLQKFTRFRHVPGDPESLSDDVISALLVDSKGTLWVGTYRGGLNRVERTPGGTVRFRAFRHDPADPTSPSSDLIWSLVDAHGSLWVAHRFAGIDATPLEGAAAPKPAFRHFRFDAGNAASLSSDNVWSMARGANGVLWVGTDGAGLNRFEVATGRCRRFRATHGELLADNVRHVFEDSSGAVWVSTPTTGLERRDPLDGSRVAFRRRASDPASLSNDQVVASLEDSEGLLWFGTWGGGVNVLDPRTARFGLQSYHEDDPTGLGPGTVKAILEDSAGTLWIGTSKGLNRRTSPAGAPPAYERVPGVLGAEHISALLEDRERRLWVGTDAGLFLYERGGAGVTRVATAIASVGDGDRVTAIRQGADGLIWFTSWKRGLCRFDGKRVEAFPLGTPDSPSQSSLMGLHIGPNEIWVGTRGEGLYRFDPATGVFEVVDPFGEDARNPGIHRIMDLAPDGSGTLWISTFGAGVWRFDPETRKAQRFAERDGLSSSFVVRALSDTQGRIWVSTSRGIDCFDPKTETVVRFDLKDGLQSSSFSAEFEGCASAGRDGRLYFGGVKGFNVFAPDEALRRYPDPPRPPVVTRFLLGNQPVPISAGGVLPRDVPYVDSLTLSHSDSLLGFEFAALSFRRPDRLRYAYRLEGFVDHWIEAGPRDRKAVYTKLPPREYTFRVRVSRVGGSWVESGAGLRIRVMPPWWKTWWASILFGAAVLGLVSGGVRYRVYSLRKKSEELQTLVVERTADLRESEKRALEARRDALEASRAKSVFLANMSHELRTPLNAILGFAQLMDRSRGLDAENREAVRTILRSGDHLLALINDVLSLSKIEAGRLELVDEPFDLVKLLENVRAMIGVRVSSRDVAVVFELSPSLPAVVRGDGRKLQQVLLNLLGNAAKFTETGSIRLAAGWEDGRARFEVRDTGPGMSQAEVASLFEAFVQTGSGQRAKEGTGLGLAISRRIVRLMGGDIAVRSAPGEGTVFTFEVALPASPTALAERDARRIVGLEGWRRPADRQGVPRILVVDDGADNRALLVKLLRATGFDAREAADGDQGIAAFRDWAPDLVFMDLRMPGHPASWAGSLSGPTGPPVLDGREATRRIREIEARDPLRGRTPIVALTASVLDHERADLLAGGADDFLHKPFNEAALFSKLKEQLGCRWVYESPAEPARLAGDEVLTRDRLRRVEPELRAALHRTLTTGDVEEARKIAARIDPGDPELSRTLEAAIRDFRLDEILSLLEANGP